MYMEVVGKVFGCFWVICFHVHFHFHVQFFFPHIHTLSTIILSCLWGFWWVCFCLVLCCNSEWCSWSCLLWAIWGDRCCVLPALVSHASPPPPSAPQSAWVSVIVFGQFLKKCWSLPQLKHVLSRPGGADPLPKPRPHPRPLILPPLPSWKLPTCLAPPPCSEGCGFFNATRSPVYFHESGERIGHTVFLSSCLHMLRSHVHPDRKGLNWLTGHEIRRGHWWMPDCQNLSSLGSRADGLVWGKVVRSWPSLWPISSWGGAKIHV